MQGGFVAADATLVPVACAGWPYQQWVATEFLLLFVWVEIPSVSRFIWQWQVYALIVAVKSISQVSIGRAINMPYMQVGRWTYQLQVNGPNGHPCATYAMLNYAVELVADGNAV